MLSEGTIVALSTAVGSGAIGVIRVSGPLAIETTARLFSPRTDKVLQQQKSHTIHLGDIKDGNQVIDEVLVSLFKNPHSYTGEDVVEISCHGSRYIQEKNLAAFYSRGHSTCTSGRVYTSGFYEWKNGFVASRSCS